MNKKLIQNLTDYRKWAWQKYLDHDENPNVEQALGLHPIHECYDSIFDDSGMWLHDVDEQGNIIPEDTAETVELAGWVNTIQFPAVIVFLFEKDWDRVGDYQVVILDWVSLREFDAPVN